MTPILSMRDVNVSEFLAVLDKCEGDVFLVTHDDDRLNLRGELSQLLGLTKLIEGGKIVNASLVCGNANDECRLFRLNMFKEVS